MYCNLEVDTWAVDPVNLQGRGVAAIAAKLASK